MSAMKLLCLSHSPLIGIVDPAPEVANGALAAVDVLRVALERFDPELIFLFGPDHYNGFFYDVLPPFCIGAQAEAIGDYGSLKGALNVPEDIAGACAASVMEQGVDCAVSYRMRVDHSFAQPLKMLAGSLTRYPVVPVFVNGLAPPMPSCQRARLLGRAIGTFAAGLNKRVLFMASGGLSHNPPAPVLGSATPEMRERLLGGGRHLTPEQRQQREANTIQAAREFIHGGAGLHPLNPEWDQAFLDVLQRRALTELDAMSNDSVTEDAGVSAHEVKSWVAANAAMDAATGGRYQARSGYYHPIPEWIAGFATLLGDST